MNEHKYDDIIKEASKKYNYPDWLLLKAQIKAESNFNPNAVSKAGAKGLCQFMSATWKQIYPDGDVFNPIDSINAQAKYMKWIQDFCDVVNKQNELPESTYEDHLICYNWGVGNWKRWNINSGDYDSLPIETQNYIKNINRYYKQYQNEILEIET